MYDIVINVIIHEYWFRMILDYAVWLLTLLMKLLQWNARDMRVGSNWRVQKENNKLRILIAYLFV